MQGALWRHGNTHALRVILPLLSFPNQHRHMYGEEGLIQPRVCNGLNRPLVEGVMAYTDGTIAHTSVDYGNGGLGALTWFLCSNERKG